MLILLLIFNTSLMLSQCLYLIQVVMKTDPLEFGHILFHSQSIERAGYSQKSTKKHGAKAHLGYTKIWLEHLSTL